MLNMIKSQSRSTSTNKNEGGFTLVEALISLVILSFIVLLLPNIYKLVVPIQEQDQYAVYQFFHLITDEISQLEIYDVSNDHIALKNNNNDTITFEHYQNVIRRRVNHTGHVILLRDAQHFELVEEDLFIQIRIVTQSGEDYEKIIRKTVP